jgi:hypothetical protein
LLLLLALLPLSLAAALGGTADEVFDFVGHLRKWSVVSGQ